MTEEDLAKWEALTEAAELAGVTTVVTLGMNDLAHAAREAMPAMIKEVRRLQGQYTALQGEMDSCMEANHTQSQNLSIETAKAQRYRDALESITVVAETTGLPKDPTHRYCVGFLTCVAVAQKALQQDGQETKS